MQKITFPKAHDLSFSSGPIYFNFETAIITGACRSGKTTLGNLLATASYVENAEEPWTAKLLPLSTGLGLIDERVGKEMFLNYVTELFNEKILLRDATFRPGDLSSIWAQKSHEEIFWRLTSLKTRPDIKKYITEHSPLLLLNLTEVLPFAHFFFDVLPKTKMIHVIRKGQEVAYDCLQKHWFSDEQLLTPIKALPYYIHVSKGKKWHLPWWVNHDEEELFLSYSEYDRCVYYWCQNVQAGLDATENFVKEGKCIVVHYEDIISDTRKTFDEVSGFLEISPTPLTEMAIAKIKARGTHTYNVNEFKITQKLLKRLESIHYRIYS
jgi:hypothetical protein